MDNLQVNVHNCGLMTQSQVRAVDDWAIGELGIAGAVLMENAGRGCAEIIFDRISEGDKVCIFCGRGNNGGDGYVVARHLVNAGVKVRVVLCCDRSRIKGDALVNLEIIERLGYDIQEIDLKSDDPGQRVKELADGFRFAIDALFGTGLSGRLGPEYISLIDGINSLSAAVVSVDIPSGLECDTGIPLGGTVRADATVTFVAVKKGFACKDACKYTGDVYVVSIGVEPQT